MKKFNKFYKKLRKYVRRYPARSAGYFTSLTMIVKETYHFQSLPLLMFLATMIIGVGEGAQRAEDKKTIAAIYASNEPEIPDNLILDKLSNKK